MKVKFYINAEKPAARAAAKELKALAATFGLTVAARGRADAVIALGGDGTILRAVHECAGVPVLGFNLGGLGYLSSVGRGDFGTALQMLAVSSVFYVLKCIVTWVTTTMTGFYLVQLFQMPAFARTAARRRGTWRTGS